MKKSAIHKERKKYIKQKRIYLGIIFFIIALLLILYLIDASKAETVTLNVSYKDYKTSEIVETNISIESDENGNYIVLPEEINGNKVNSYYIEDIINGEKTTNEYNINEKYYITGQNKIEIIVLYEGSEENVEEEKDEVQVIYIGEIGQEGEEGTELNPYKSIETAISQITEESATIVVEGEFTLSSWASKNACSNKKIILRGYDENTVLTVTGNLNFYSETIIKGITIKIPNINIYFCANGNPLTLGTSKKDDLKIESDYKKYPYIYGGSATENITKDTNIIINSGTYQYVYGGSNNKTIKGSTNVVVNDGEIRSAIYGGSYGSTITGSTNITLNGGKYGIDLTNNTTEVISGGSNTGTITVDTNLTVNEITILNGCISGAGKTCSVKNNINMTIKGATLGLEQNGTNPIYGAGYKAGSTASKNVNMTIDTIYGTPSSIIGYCDNTGGNMATTAVITMNISNLNSNTTKIYGGAYNGTQTNNASLVMNISNVKASILSAGGNSSYKVSKYTININNSSRFETGIYLGVSTNGQANVNTDSNSIKFTDIGKQETPQLIYYRNKKANITMSNSYITTSTSFYTADLTLNNSNMTIESLASNLANITMDTSSLIKINTTTAFNITENLSGTGTLKLMDTTKLYINGTIQGNTKIDITEKTNTTNHYINIISTTPHAQELLYFNTELVKENGGQYSTDFITGEMSYWKFYNETEMQSVPDCIYIDNTNGNDQNTGEIKQPIKTLAKAAQIIKNNSSKTKVVLLANLNLNNEETTETIEDTNIIVTKTDGTIDFGKGIVLEDSTYTNNIYQNITFQNITITSKKGEQLIYANGTNLKMGTGVTVSGSVDLYGGSKDSDIDTTNLTINSGTWYKVYGGSKDRTVTTTNLTITGGTFSNQVFAGSDTGTVETTNLNISGGIFNNQVFGGSNTGNANTTKIKTTGGTFNNQVIAGSNSGITTITNLTITGGTIKGNVYGGSIRGNVEQKVNVNIETNGTISGILYGGNNTGEINANIEMNIKKGTFSNIVYGGSAEGTVNGNIITTIDAGTFSKSVYGGSATATTNGTIELRIKAGIFNKNIYGGSNTGNVNQDILLNIEGGAFNGTNTIYGGSNSGKIKNVNTTISNVKFANAITIYGGGENVTVGSTETPTTITLNLSNLTCNKTSTIYGGANKGSIIGNTILNIKTTTFVGATNIYRGCNAASITGTINSKFEEIEFKSTSSKIYGGSNSGTINGDVNFELSQGAFKNNECNATIYGGSDTGTITGTLTNKLNGITFKGDLIGSSNTGALNNGATITYNNISVSGNIYSAKYTGNNISKNITVNITDSRIAKLYVFNTYSSINQQIEINLNNVSSISENPINIYSSKDTTTADLSNYATININNSKTSEILINEKMKIKKLKIDNTNLNIENNIETTNIEIKNGAEVSFEKNVVVKGDFIGSDDENYGTIYVYDGMDISGNISGTTILSIGTVTGAVNNDDFVFISSKENKDKNISTIENNIKTWRVGKLNYYMKVFVDGENGDDTNDGDTADNPFATIRMAYLSCKDGATIVVSGATTITKWPAATEKAVTITSQDGDVDYRYENSAALILSCDDLTTSSMSLKKDTTFKYLNMTLEKEQSIYANGNTITFGVEGDETSLNIRGGNQYLNVYGGSYNTNIGSTNLKIYSGSYKTIYGGSNGTTTIMGDSNKTDNIAQNVLIAGGNFGASATSETIVMGNRGGTASYTYGRINLDIKNTQIQGYVLSSGYASTTYGNVNVNIGKNVSINGYLFTDGNLSRISPEYTYTLNIDGEDGQTSISNIIYGSENKGNGSKTYNTTITNATIGNIYYGSLNASSGSADTIKGSVYINILDGCKISNIYCGRYAKDTTIAGDFYITVGTEETLTTNIYRLSPNGGGKSNICQIEFTEKNMTYSGILQNITTLNLTNSTVQFTNTINTITNLNVVNSNINFKNAIYGITTANIKDNSEVNITGSRYGATTTNLVSSTLNLSNATTNLSLGNLNIDLASNMKILSNTNSIAMTGNLVGGGNLYLNDNIKFTIGGIVQNSTKVYCNTESYFPTSVMIIASYSANTPENAFVKPEDQSSWYYKDNEGKRIWQIKEFEDNDIIYINTSKGVDYGIGTTSLPVKTLEQAYGVANNRYTLYGIYRKYYIVLQTDLVQSTITDISKYPLNSDIQVEITNTYSTEIKYATKLKITTTAFNFVGNTTINNLTIDTTSQSQGVEFFGNGNNITIGNNVTINSVTAKYPIIYGGGNTNDIIKSNYSLEILSGKYNMIYGGGKTGNVTSSINLKIGTENTIVNVMQYVKDDDNYTGVYGGGMTGTVNGNISLNIYSGEFYRIYGAGLTGNVTGNVTLNYRGGTTKRLYGGGMKGEVKGNVNANIGNNANTTATITNYLRGSGQYQGITGTATVNIYNGANIQETTQFATGGYQGNVSTAKLNIYGGTINCDIYTGGWGLIRR